MVNVVRLMWRNMLHLHDDARILTAGEQLRVARVGRLI